MKTLEQLKEMLKEENTQLFNFLGIDTTTQYGYYTAIHSNPDNITACYDAGIDMETKNGAYTAESSNPDNIKACFLAGIDMTTQYGFLIASDFTLEMIKNIKLIK